MLETEVLRLHDKVAKVPGIADLTTSVKPGHPGLRGAAQARRGARARPDDDAARGQPAQLRQRRRRHLVDLARRRAGRRRAAPAARRARERRAARQPAGRLRQGRHADRAVARRRHRAGGQPGRHQAPGPAASPGDLRRHRRAGRAATSAPTCRRSSRRRSCRPATASTSAARPRSRHEAFQGVLMALGAAVIFIYIVLASQFGSFLQPLAIMASLPLALIGVMLALLVTRSTHQPVLDDRPGDADGPGDEERDPAGRLRQPRPARRPVGARGAAPGRAGADAADHHDHRGDDLRHAAAGAGAERRRRDPGADGPGDHRRRHHLDPADAGGGAGALFLPGARPQAQGDAAIRRRRRPLASGGTGAFMPASKE